MWEIELTEEQIKDLREAGKSGKIKVATEKESCIHVLRGLISYHERMTMGDFPQKDFYVDALKYAIKCVEENGEQ